MAQTRLVTLAFLAVVLTPVAASAQEPIATPTFDDEEPEASAPPEMETAPEVAPEYLEDEVPRYGFALTVGLGINHLNAGSFRDVTQLGAQAEARVIFGTRSPLAAEVGYVGTLRDINTLARDDDALLMSNGVEGLLRINGGQYETQFYLLGGAGWNHYSVVHHRRVTASDLAEGDNVISLPVGGGISGFVAEGFLVDVRFVYRFAFDEDLFTHGMGDGRNPKLDSWSLTVQVGYEF